MLINERSRTGEVMSPTINDFTFPLNVYAHILEKEEGRVDYLHCGLFNQQGISTNEAQTNSTELLWRHLPPPCKLLEVGIGLGTTLARLCREGYSATGITPDAPQIAYARTRYGKDLPTVCAKLENYCEETGQWHALLFQESAQYIDPIDLFEAASRLLIADGEIVVMDTFALQRTENHKENFHYLEHFLQLAERAGFSLETRIDLTQLAAPTLDWLLISIKRHTEALCNELGVSLEALEALKASSKVYRDKYAKGQLGYFLLCFKRISLPIWRIGRLFPESSHEMRELFSEVFHHEMTEAHWQWKYGEGRGGEIGVWRTADGKLVAHYGGGTRNILLFGQPVYACQVCDVMVSPSDRGTLSRKGPVFLASATFFEHETGYGTPHLLAFGFPSNRSYRLHKILGLYASYGAMQELVWPAESKGASWLWKIDEIYLNTQKEISLADLCWSSMATDLSNRVVGVRDSTYLRQRYLEHPDKNYRIFVVHRCFSLQIAGLFVVRVDNPNRCELLDTIGPIIKIPLLIRHAQQVAKDSGCRELFLWAVDNIVLDFGPCPTIKDLRINAAGNGWISEPANELVAGTWWLTGGDTDFH